jgi:hypothetical protein
MSGLTVKMLTAAAALMIAMSFAPKETAAQSREYRTADRGPDYIGFRVLPGAKRAPSRRTAVRGSSQRVGGFSYNLQDSFDFEVLPPAPRDFGPYLDNSNVVVDGPISQDPYP